MLGRRRQGERQKERRRKGERKGTGDIKFRSLSLELKGKIGNTKIRFLYNTFQNNFNQICILAV